MISIENLTYYYPDSEKPALQNINLKINKGEFVLLVGPTGSGKSTLLQCLNGIIPRVTGGRLEGKIEINGKTTTQHKVYQLSQIVGMVFQNPDTQLFGLTVEEDTAFGPENLGLPRREIQKRVEKALETTGIPHLRDRFTFTLSGGEKQRTAIAGNLAMKPEILVLDEPTSDLDPQGTKQVLETIKKLNREQKITIILAEHKIDQIIKMATRTIVMDRGTIILDGKTSEIFKNKTLENIGIHSPQLKHLPQFKTTSPRAHPAGNPQIIFENVYFSYHKTPVLRNINLTINKGEFMAIIGPNGSGKTTLLGCLIGLIKPTQGRVLIEGEDISKKSVPELAEKVGYLFQNPDYQLFTDTVTEEIAFGLKNRNLPPTEIEKRVEKTLETMELTEYRDRHPQSLSRGQRQRLALASILALEPEVLLLDEPTTGQDRGHLKKLLQKIKELNNTGKTILLVTHDMDLALENTHRTIVMKDGRILLDAPTPQVLSEILEKASFAFQREITQAMLAACSNFKG